MTQHFHAVVWIDHREAYIFHFGREGVERVRVRAPDRQSGHIHHKAGTLGAGHSEPDRHYFAAVAEELASSKEVLVVGPGTARTELTRYIRDHVSALAPRIMGVEPLERVCEAKVLEFAQAFFVRKDRMNPLQ